MFSSIMLPCVMDPTRTLLTRRMCAWRRKPTSQKHNAFVKLWFAMAEDSFTLVLSPVTIRTDSLHPHWKHALTRAHLPRIHWNRWFLSYVTDVVENTHLARRPLLSHAYVVSKIGVTMLGPLQPRDYDAAHPCLEVTSAQFAISLLRSIPSCCNAGLA